MRLYEYEAKNLLEKYGLETPGSKGENFVVKAQVLTENRKKHGGIKFAETRREAEKLAEKMKDTEVKGHNVTKVLIEERIEYEEEYYIGVIYDTDVRKPVLVFGENGGTGIEEQQTKKLELEDKKGFEIQEFLEKQGINDRELAKTLKRLINCFFEEDARMAEVNPLVKSGEKFTALDAMIDLDDDASYRHERVYPERSEFPREKTEREIEAEKIDKDDHRGIAGKYTEMDGDIGMMLAGGGASLTNMDALIEYGGEPANYTEYGGNPTTEKTYRLSKIIMSKPGLKGLWHVGGTANNTDIYRTMKGFCQALEEEKPSYPIVVRRDGPNADKAFRLLKETRDKHGLNMKLYRNDTPMTKTANILMEMIENE